MSTTDFGWGSIGKLRLILDELDGFDILVDDASRTAELAAQVIGGGHRFASGPAARAAAALVINDPVSADRIAHSGTPVVYLDSLPYLWTTDSEVPTTVAVYCAQQIPTDALPPSSPVHRVADVRWVEPIVPPPRPRRGGTGVVVNVGGLHSHLVGGACDAYLHTVLIPLVDALVAARRQVAAVCGNLPAWACAELAARLPGPVRVGPHSAYAFESALLEADALITSPGSTTILQAATAGLPTTLLPPQNLSQILNAEIFGVPGRGVITWPLSVIDRAVVDTLRPAGEDTVLRYVYRQIAEHSGDPAVRSVLIEQLGALAACTTAPDGLSPGLRQLGHRGARQVAHIVRQTILAPPAVGRR